MKTNRKNPLFRRLLGFAFASVIVIGGNAAEISYKIPSLSTPEATTSTNWVGDIAPDSGDVAAWKTDGDPVEAGNQESRGGVISISSPVSWLGLRHEDSTGPLTLIGEPITLGASGITEVRWETLLIHNDIVLAADQTWTNTSLTTVGGDISGAFSFTKAGTGSLFLLGENSFAGPVDIRAGGVFVTSLNSVVGGSPTSGLGAAPEDVASGTIALSAGGSQAALGYLGSGETSDRVIHFASGSGGIITQNGSGPLHLTSDMTGAAAAMGIILNGGGVASMNGITNTTALLNFNKQGLGTWTVNGDVTPNGGNIRFQGGIFEFSSTSSTTGNAIIGTASNGRTTGGVVRFATGSSIKTASANTNDILGGWATFDNTTWAKANGSGNAIDGLTSFTDDTWAAGNNTNATLAGGNPASGSTTNSLRFNEASAKTLTLAGANVIASGGLLVTPNVGANDTLITGGSLQGAASSDLVVHQHNTGGSLTISSVISNNTGATALTKTGVGTLILNGANNYTGVTRVFEGKLTVNANSGPKLYEVSGSGILEFGYGVGETSGYGVTVSGNGVDSSKGLYIKGGINIGLRSGLVLQGKPTTVRSYGDGNAILGGWDTGGVYLTVQPEASGSVIASTINFTPGNYGYRMNIFPGINTATGDIIFRGQLTGNTNGNGTHYRKMGMGSLALAGASTNIAPLRIFEGSVILIEGNDRIGTGAAVALGDGGLSGKLVLNGFDQTLADLYTMGTGTANAVVGGAATLSTLSVNYSGSGGTYTGTIGGVGTNENNIAFRKSGTGVYTLAGNNTYTGGTIVSAGTLSLGSVGAVGETGEILLNGGVLQFTEDNSRDYASDGRLALEDGVVSTLDTNGQNVSISGALGLSDSKTGGLKKVGAGVLTISFPQEYTGDTVLSEGVLELDYGENDEALLSPDSRLKLEGGILRLTGGTHEQEVLATTVSGAVTIERMGGSSVINLGQMDQTGLGALNLAEAGIAKISGFNEGEALPAWITIGGELASVDASGNIIEFTGFEDVFRLGGVIPDHPGSVVRIVNGGDSGSVTVAESLTRIGNLQQTADEGEVIVDLDGNALHFGADALISLGEGASPLMLSNGEISAGTDVSTFGVITIDNAADVTIAAELFDKEEGVHPLSLVKANTGDLVLAEANFSSGGVTLQEGGLFINTPHSIGHGPLSIFGGKLGNSSGEEILTESGPTQFWGGDFEFVGPDDLTFGSGAVTLVGNRAIDVSEGTLTIGGAISGAHTLTKGGAGRLVLNGANSYTGGMAQGNNPTGPTFVNGGTLEVNANSGGKLYTIAAGATLELGYGSGTGGYAYGVTVNGDGVESSAGLYLKTGFSSTFADGLVLQGAPTTVRGLGDGVATLYGWDTGRIYLTVQAAASGSVIDEKVNHSPNTYGYRFNIASGDNTTSGDLTLRGSLVGTSGVFRKEGAGSMVLEGAGTNTSPLEIYSGSVILSGGDNRIGSGARVALGSGSGSGRLILNGVSQTLANLTTSGTGTTNAVVGTSASPSTIQVNYTGGTPSVFSGTLGGAGTNENNLSVVKLGGGTWALRGSNTYTGTTTVQGGELRLEGSLAQSDASVHEDAGISGIGPVASLVVAAGGVIAPGNNSVLPSEDEKLTRRIIGGGGISSEINTSDLQELHNNEGAIIPNNTTYAYSGEIYLPGEEGTNYYFAENFDDGIILNINGQSVLVENGWSEIGIGSFVSPGPGWYSFELNAIQGGGGVGPVAANGWGPGKGVGFSVTNPSAPTHGDSYAALTQSNLTSAGILLRTERAEEKTIATFSVAGNAEIGGTYHCQIHETVSDLLAVGENLAINGALLEIEGTATADEYVIATWQGTRTGIFSNASALPSGYGLQYDDVAKTVKLVAGAGGEQTFASWMSGFTFDEDADLSPAGDADGDGIPNAVEFVIGNDPSVVSVENLPTIELVTDPGGVPAGDYLLFTFRRTQKSVDAEVTAVAEYDQDLAGPWAVAIDDDTNVFIREDEEHYGGDPRIDRVRVYVSRSLAISGKLFGRLKVEVPSEED